MRDEIIKELPDYIYLRKYENNIQIIPTSGTITIVKNDGSDMPDPVEDESITIDADGTMKYQINAANCAYIGEAFKATWKYIYGGITYQVQTLFDIVLSKLQIVITEQDLIDRYEPLQEDYYRMFGKITSVPSSLNQLIDAESFTEADDYFTGGKIKMLSGLSQDFESKVNAYEQSTGTFTLVKNFPNSRAINDKFVVSTSYQNDIESAWNEILSWIRNKGLRPALIMDSESLKELHILMTLRNIFFKAGEPRRYEYEEYKAAANTKKSNTKFIYDTDEEGNPSTADDESGQVFLQR